MPTGADMTSVWSLQLRNPARVGRMHDAAFLYPGPGGPLAHRDGVLPSATDEIGVVTDLRIVPATTPSREVWVLPGQCVITAPGTGPYLCTLESAVPLMVDPAHATLPRLDAVVARVRDDAVSGGGISKGDLIPITGTPASTPTAPATPAGCTKIGHALVPSLATMPVTALGTAQLSPQRKGAAVRGTPRHLLEADDPNEAGPLIGAERIYSRVRQVWTGLAWETVYRIGDVRPTLYADLRRDDGQMIVNGTGAYTNLGIFNPVTTGGGWTTNYVARGASHPRDGLWMLDMTLASDVASARYTDAFYTQVTNAGSVTLPFPAEDVAATGFGGTGGTHLLRVPRGEPLRVYFDAYKNNAPNATILAGSYARLTWLGEP